MAFHVVATEGATTDGRKIERKWIEQIAKNYSTAKYGARIFLEHLRGVLPDGPFRAYGDIKAVKTQENAEGQLQLLADIDPTDDLKALNGKRQKVYSSIEVDPDFAGTGEAYLVGMAVTDSPASLGTAMLEFSAQQGDKSPLAHRKQRPTNVFTASQELDLTDLGKDVTGKNDGPSLFEQLKGIFNKSNQTTIESVATLRAEVQQSLELLANKVAALQPASTQPDAPTASAFTKLQSDHADLLKRFNELHSKLSHDPDRPLGKPATGGADAEQTDC